MTPTDEIWTEAESQQPAAAKRARKVDRERERESWWEDGVLDAARAARRNPGEAWLRITPTDPDLLAAYREGEIAGRTPEPQRAGPSAYRPAPWTEMLDQVFADEDRFMEYREVIDIAVRMFPEELEIPRTRTDRDWLRVRGDRRARSTVKQAVHEARTRWKQGKSGA